jgi:hypothetical protein
MRRLETAERPGARLAGNDEANGEGAKPWTEAMANPIAATRAINMAAADGGVSRFLLVPNHLAQKP